MKSRHALALAWCLGLGTPMLAASPTFAQEPPSVSEEDQAEAKERFAKARYLYKAGKYRAAIGELKAAHRLDPTGAELVYNMGVVHEKLGEVEEAISAYRKYQDMIDEEEEKQRIEDVIARLQGAKTELKAGEPEDTPTPQPQPFRDPKPEHGRFDGWVIASGVVALGGIAVGTIFGLKAMKDEVENPPKTSTSLHYNEIEERSDKANREALIADIGFGVGAAAAITGAILYFVREKPPSTEQARGSFTPSVAPVRGGAFAGFQGVF